MKRAWLGIFALALMANACETYDPAAPSPGQAAAPAAEQPSAQTATAKDSGPEPTVGSPIQRRAAGGSCCGSGACQQAKAETGTCPCRAAAKAAGLDMPSCGGEEH